MDDPFYRFDCAYICLCCFNCFQFFSYCLSLILYYICIISDLILKANDDVMQVMSLYKKVVEGVDENGTGEGQSNNGNFEEVFNWLSVFHSYFRMSN